MPKPHPSNNVSQQQAEKGFRRLTLSSNMNINIQLVSPVPHQVGILQERPSHQHRINRPLIQIPLRLLPRSNPPDGPNKTPGPRHGLAHRRRVRDLVSRPGRDFLPRIQPAARDVEEVDAVRGEQDGELGRVGHGPLWEGGGVLEVVGGGYADQERVGGRDEGAG